LDISIEIGVLKEEILPLVEDIDPNDLKQIIMEIGSQYIFEEKYAEARLCIWALE